MTNNQFDNFFREQLKDHSTAIPDGLWEKIMPKNKKRPTTFYFLNNWGLSLLVTSLILGGIYGSTSYIHSLNNHFVKRISIIEKNTIANGTKLAVENNTSAKNKAIPNESIEIILTNNLVKNTAKIAKQKQPILSNNHIKNTLPNNLQTDNYTNSTQFINESKNKPVAGKDGSIINKSQVSGNSFLNNKAAFQKGTAPSMLFNQSVEENKAVFTKIDESLPILINATDANNHFSLVNKTLDFNEHDKKIQGIIICPSIKGRSSFNSDWGIELYASPDYALKYVSNISAPQQYLDKKDSSEQMQISYTAGFRLIKPLNDNFLLKAGFQYSQLNQKFSYRNENEYKTTTVITARTIIRSAGDTILVSDTSVLRQIGYSVNTVHNQFRSIDIPVTLGYQFGNDDLKFGINAGVVFNLSSWYQGEILDTTYASVPMNKVSNALYKTNIGMGLYTSMSLIKRINDNTHLFFEPYFRYNLSNMTNSASPYNQRFHIGGLSVGLRFDLNR